MVDKFLREVQKFFRELESPVEFAFATIPQLIVLYLITPRIVSLGKPEGVVEWISDPESLGGKLAFPLLVLGIINTWFWYSKGWSRFVRVIAKWVRQNKKDLDD